MNKWGKNERAPFGRIGIMQRLSSQENTCFAALCTLI